MKQLTLLIVLWLIIGMTGTDLMAKTQRQDYNPIEWEKGDKGGRSLLPISGYVEEGIVTIYLYESPTEATVRIVDESGSAVYENGYANPETLVIEMDGQSTGSYRITVEYEGKVFYGSFLL